MRLKRYIFLCLAALGCRSIPFHPESYPGRYLIIGEGGGFSGVETSWYFTERGDIYNQVLGDTSMELKGRINKKIIDQIWTSVDQLNLTEYQYQQPANSYKFISLPLGTQMNRIVWSSSDQKIHPACVNIYRILKQNIDQNE